MVYVQFYKQSLFGPPPEYPVIEAVGDRGVVILDGRSTRRTWYTQSEQLCRSRGFIAFQIFKGDSFSRSRAVSELMYLTASSTSLVPPTTTTNTTN
jgi:hypothetical protein